MQSFVVIVQLSELCLNIQQLEGGVLVYFQPFLYFILM